MVGGKGYWARTPRIQVTLRIQGTQGKQGKLQTHETAGGIEDTKKTHRGK